MRESVLDDLQTTAGLGVRTKKSCMRLERINVFVCRRKR